MPLRIRIRLDPVQSLSAARTSIGTHRPDLGYLLRRDQLPLVPWMPRLSTSLATRRLLLPTLPTDRIRPPTEGELFLFGRTAGSSRPRSGGAGEVARQDFSGSYGYVME